MRIVNIKHKPTPAYTLYMGRANYYMGLPQSKWANPIVLKKEADRPQCLFDFVGYAIEQQELISSIEELRDEVCGCYCRPLVCHCDVWHYMLHNQHNNIRALRFFYEKSDPATLFAFLTDWRDVSV